MDGPYHAYLHCVNNQPKPDSEVGLTALATKRSYPKRRRRRPEEAEREILEAAEQVIRQRPWHEVTVERVMAETTLSREAFYAYFRDRNELIARLAQRLREQIDAYGDLWRAGTGDVFADGRAALEGLVSLYAEHGAVLRALADAAGQDPDAGRVWRAFVEAGDARSAQRISEDIRRGLIPKLDPNATARALCAMNREYLFQVVVGNPKADLDAVVHTLHAIWWRTLYESDSPYPPTSGP
jgi:TetR/AcrR family transcriptional regulator, ethionamide resistance regulator